ncbi:transmembrane protein 17-like [Saccoglossus kowalevskii]|uniref:Transmembrane protein 17-like n=1 Tax=Saccoglossus kowalevskii TaxID=10224 RepID=A0ABM0GKC9_SACKO|nr:PREDICTED: transmembrane protein 17-like [Saccoglossus kowalevskii]
MAADIAKQKFSSFAEYVFPGITVRDRRQKHAINPGNEIVSNLPLQMILYFNVFYFPLWLITCVVMYELKFHYLDEFYKFILITVYIVVACIEVIRLYLGYKGNLMEKVPELAGFWLLTLVIQLPLSIFLIANQGSYILPIEYSIHIIFLLFIGFEILMGFIAIRVMADHQMTKFHLQQFDEIPDLEQDGYLLNPRYETRA